MIQNSLARALIAKENYDDAVELLNEAIRREKELRAEDIQEERDS